MTQMPENVERTLRRIADIQTRLQQYAPADRPAFLDLVSAAEAAPVDTEEFLPAAYTGPGRTAAAPADLEALIADAAARYQLRPALLRAVIQTESGFNPQAVSPKGAQGLMQLMPATAAGLGVTDPFDPAQNVMAGARYLRENLDRFHGDERLALAAYNAGPGAVQRYHGVPPYLETQRYVSRILSLAGED